MGPHKDENKLQVDEKNNKFRKVLKTLTKYNITNFKTIRYKLTAPGKIIHLIPNYKLIRPARTLRLPKE